jgi:hypothetical protein
MPDTQHTEANLSASYPTLTLRCDSDPDDNAVFMRMPDDTVEMFAKDGQQGAHVVLTGSDVDELRRWLDEH